jgi:hypothetical protein
VPSAWTGTRGALLAPVVTVGAQAALMAPKRNCHICGWIWSAMVAGVTRPPLQANPRQRFDTQLMRSAACPAGSAIPADGSARAASHNTNSQHIDSRSLGGPREAGKFAASLAFVTFGKKSFRLNAWQLGRLCCLMRFQCASPQTLPSG